MAIYAHVTSFAKVQENIKPEIEPINNDQLTDFQKMLDLIKQIEELIEPYRAHNSELSDIEILKKFFTDIMLLNSPVQICR